MNKEQWKEYWHQLRLDTRQEAIMFFKAHPECDIIHIPKFIFLEDDIYYPPYYQVFTKHRSVVIRDITVGKDRR